MQIRNPNIRFAEYTDAEIIRHMMEIAVSRLPSRDWYLDDNIDYISRHTGGPEGYTLIWQDGCRSAAFLLIHHPGLSEENLGRYLSLPDEELPAVSHMESACVLPEYQGRHILSQLLSEAALLEKGRGCRYLMATIHPDNLFSKNSHLRCGFEELMTVKKYGDWMRTIMVKRL